MGDSMLFLAELNSCRMARPRVLPLHRLTSMRPHRHIMRDDLPSKTSRPPIQSVVMLTVENDYACRRLCLRDYELCGVPYCARLMESLA